MEFQLWNWIQDGDIPGGPHPQTHGTAQDTVEVEVAAAEDFRDIMTVTLRDRTGEEGVTEHPLHSIVAVVGMVTVTDKTTETSLHIHQDSPRVAELD